MPVEIKKTGLIPVSTDAKYKTNYQLLDTNIGKYISLNGSRTFYNPGIGTILQSPTPVTTVSDTNFTVNTSGGQIKNEISGKPNQTGFLFFNTKNPKVDDIIGSVKIDGQAINNGVNGITDISQIYSQGNYRVLNVINSGTYIITVTADGNIGIQSNDGGFAAVAGFYLNINHNEQLISPLINGVTNNRAHNQQVNLDYNFTFSQTLNLTAGDFIQVYGKVLSDYSKENNTLIFNNGNFYLNIDYQTSSTATSQFTNPLNLTDLNTSTIKFYGAGRDTLILQNNKLIF